MQTNTYNEKATSPRAEGTFPAKVDKMTKAKSQLASDFSTLVSDAEELLKSTASYSGETVNSARAKFQDTLAQFKGRVASAQSAAAGKFNEAAKVTDTYVHENPWKIVGVAAAVGVILGILMHRK